MPSTPGNVLQTVFLIRKTILVSMRFSKPRRGARRGLPLRARWTNRGRLALVGRWTLDDALGLQVAGAQSGVIAGVALDFDGGVEQMAVDIVARRFP